MPANSSLRGRIPGQLAMSAVVATQWGTAPRSRLGCIFGRSPLTAQTRTMYRAALGELAVGDMLDNLGLQWDVLHVLAVDTVGKDIDHLVIGPPGVFAVTIENFPGQEVTVNGDFLSVGNVRVDDIARARKLAASAAKLLAAAAGTPIVVTPLLVVVTATTLTLRQQPEGATVIESRQLLHYLGKLDRTLDGTEVAFISDVADRPTTWRAATGPVQDTHQLSNDFADLRADVQEATQARIFWGVIAFGIIAGCVWASTMLVLQNLIDH